MSEGTWVQGDTGPDINATLTSNDLPVDLTGAAVRFQMRKDNDRRYTVNAVATIVNAATGRVKYEWGPNDLVNPGDYQVQWETTFSGGVVQTSDPPNEITIRRQ